MQTLARPQTSSLKRRPRRGGFSPLMLIGVSVTVGIALLAGAFFVVRPYLGSHAAADNPNCSLIVPQQPLTAQGLATPYQLVATDPNQGPCNETNPAQGAFVQGAVIDPATGQVSIYNPVVVNKGQQPARPAVVPTLPQGAVVGLWFGFNGAALTLKNAGNSLKDGKCVNGLKGDIFGQFSYCNAPAFFAAANQAIQAGKLAVPALGTGNDGLPCPTVRDFGVVDQDQSDNVTTTYLMTPNGKVAQMTARNMAALKSAQILANGSDNRLVAVALDGALNCKPWTAPDLADPGNMVPAVPLNELLAAARQSAPVATVPSRDPMVTVNGNPNLTKLNAYRVGVDQPQVQNGNMASTKTYCSNLLAIAPLRMLADAQFTKVRQSPDPAAANTLFNFLAQRFVTTWGADGGLNCQGLLNQPSPISVTKDNNGVAIDAVVNGVSIKSPTTCAINGSVIVPCKGNQATPAPAASTPPATAPSTQNNNAPATPGTAPQNNTAPTPAPTSPSANAPAQSVATPSTPSTSVSQATGPIDCTVNGTLIAGCSGTTQIGDQTCAFVMDKQTNRINITCPAPAKAP